MIYIEPVGGLCNRLRVLASAYRLAKENGKEFTVVWICDGECNCRFDKIFEPIPICHFIYERPQNVKKVNNTYGCKEVLKVPKADWKNLIEQDVYIASYSDWYDQESDFVFLKLKKNLQKRVAKLAGRCGDDYVGVHIRRTDNLNSIEHSPTELFIQKMEEECISKPETVFFVASDNVMEKKNLRKKFGSKAVMNGHISLKRNSAKGIMMAAVELYVLAGSIKIIGSYWSSFTDVAARIGNIPAVVCKR